MGEGGGGLKGRGISRPFPQPPTLQVLEVLTAAVEYGLEELREVGVDGRPISVPLPLMGSVHTMPHTLWPEKEHAQYKEKNGSLCKQAFMCACMQRVCALWGRRDMWDVYGWCYKCQDKSALLPALQREIDT